MRSALFAWFNAKVDHINDAMAEVVEDSIEEGERLTDQHIRTRGTARSGKQGRIETEAMVDSVDSAMVKKTQDEVIGRFGYNDAPFYTVFQELGTRRIEAMHALGDAAEEVLADLPKKLTKAMRSG